MEKKSDKSATNWEWAGWRGTRNRDNRKQLRKEEAIKPETGTESQALVSASGKPISWPVHQLPVSV